jgi:hypothetical protein
MTASLEDRIKELYNNCIIRYNQIHNMPRIIVIEIDEEFVDMVKGDDGFYRSVENGASKRKKIIDNGLVELGYKVVYTGSFEGGCGQSIELQILKEVD